jgi:hypothetical protein
MKNFCNKHKIRTFLSICQLVYCEKTNTENYFQFLFGLQQPDIYPPLIYFANELTVNSEAEFMKSTISLRFFWS